MIDAALTLNQFERMIDLVDHVGIQKSSISYRIIIL